MKTHDKEFFYKYLTSDVAIKILKTQTVLCSAPECFNDPFDSQLPIQFDSLDEELIRSRLSDAILDKISNIFKKTKPTLTKENKNEIFKDISISETLRKLCSEIDEKIKTEFCSDRIFCVSEIFDSLLMWAHYSDNHKGAVIRFRCLPGDYAFNAAKRVIYSTELPKLVIEELIEGYFSKERVVEKKIVSEILLTKSIDWEYEKEWRIILLQQNPFTKQDLRGVVSKEIDAIYLGCKMLPENEETIKNIVKAKLNHVKIFKAQKSNCEFKLNFTEIKDF